MSKRVNATLSLKQPFSVMYCSPFVVRRINDQLMQLDRAFLDPQGLPGRKLKRSEFIRYVNNCHGLVDTIKDDVWDFMITVQLGLEPLFPTVGLWLVWSGVLLLLLLGDVSTQYCNCSGNGHSNYFTWILVSRLVQIVCLSLYIYVSLSPLSVYPLSFVVFSLPPPELSIVYINF